jgi:Flp pilus assembly protein TadG
VLSFFQRFKKDRQGASIIEFAVTLPIVMVISFGAADYGRLFMETAILASASSAGAIYGARLTKEASDLNGAEAAVLANVNGLQSVSAEVTKLCDCPAAPGTWISCTSTCTGYGSPRIYIRSKAEKNFDTFGTYPNVPSHVDLGISTWMRVQ